MAAPKINFDIVSGFTDTAGAVPVLRADAGGGNFGAFVYQCQLNLDKDGAPNTYGWDNPADLNSLGLPNDQKNLHPLENWGKGSTTSIAQFVGLGNACGDPGNGSKGWQNFVNGDHNFRWASVVALTKRQAGNQVVIDDRPELEALRDQDNNQVAAGSGFFPMVQRVGPFKGYYVSTTATVTDGRLDDSNTDKWVNAAVVPYAVWADAWANFSIGGKSLALGDFGLAINNQTGAYYGFFYGDAGTQDKVGEVSQRLYSALSGGASPLCTFIAFPGSGPGNVVGTAPEGRIPSGLRPKVVKLPQTDNPSDLLERIYLEDDMRAARAKSYLLTAAQVRVYLNVARALNMWGGNFETDAPNKVP